MANANETYLIDAWEAEMAAIAAIGTAASAEQWHAPTRLAGWSVADIVAHVIDIESVLAGDPRPDHVPDYASLPHVDEDIARFTEVGVDARRGLPKDAVIAELGDIRTRRIDVLRALPDDAEVLGPTGRLQPLVRMLSMRCLDLWTHEQDLRAALGLPADHSSAACDITYRTAIPLSQRSWQAQDPSPGALTITVTEPEAYREVLDFAGAGDALALACTMPELLDRMIGRDPKADSRWRALVIAP